MYQSIEIGTFTLDAPRTVREHYETASWYRDVLVQPGIYPLWAAVRWERRTYPGYVAQVWAKVPGVVTGAYFASPYDKQHLGVIHTVSVGIENCWTNRTRPDGSVRDASVAKDLLITDPRVFVHTWDPEDHHHDPTRDYTLMYRLMYQCAPGVVPEPGAPGPQ